jgi:hypothetical protein
MTQHMSKRCRETSHGGAEGNRTPDPLHAMQVRYQLRHSPILLFEKVTLSHSVLSLPNKRSGIDPALCSVKLHFPSLPGSKMDQDALESPPNTPHC